MLFHPLYNADGSLSVFRLICLTVTACCLLSYPFVKNSGQSSQSAASSQETASSKTSVLGSFIESDEKKELKKLQKIRKDALVELKSGFDFLNSCGNINAGFEGCSFKFSEEVLKFYDAKVTTADDGFSIELKAKKDMQKDECVQFSINSLGEFKALDKMNRATDKCTPKDFVKKNLSTIYRATDYIEGQAAPSGRVPVVVKTAQSSSKQKDITSIN